MGKGCCGEFDVVAGVIVAMGNSVGRGINCCGGVLV